MLGIVVSRADEASEHIGEQALALDEWDEEVDESRPDARGGGTVYRLPGVELRTFDDRHLDLERPADAFDDPDLLAFASRHAGDTGKLLTAHHTGNFGPADHGGDPESLARAAPNALDRVLEALDTHAPDGYDVGIECTHHGPTDVGAPSLFVEVGSAESEWADPDAAEAVARAVLDLRDVAPDRPSTNGSAEDEFRRHLVGFGGGHYAPRFERVLRETDWAVGHVAADWGIDAMGDVDSQAAHRVLDATFSESRAAYALVEGERSSLRETLRDLGYRPVTETWVRETDGVPLPFVRRVESALTTVSDGLRFGERATEYDDSFVEATLPEALIDEARRIDRESTRAVVAEATLAFVTDQGGTRPTSRVVLDSDSAIDAIVDGLTAILEETYDDVERTDEAVVARRTTFDPDRARTLGVPDGPKFGRLADGEPVEVDGDTIPPSAVTRETERRFPLK